MRIVVSEGAERVEDETQGVVWTGVSCGVFCGQKGGYFCSWVHFSGSAQVPIVL